MPNMFRFKFLCCTVTLAFLAFPAIAAPQSARSDQLPVWKEARGPAAKGTRARIPKDILAELTADASQDSADPCSKEESSKMDAYRAVLNSHKPVVAIAVWGRSSCYCGATGNCQFWLFVADHGKHRLVLDTGLVRDFGFLKARTKGYRDLVLWSHDFAFRSPARLFQFDGNQYREACGWEEEYVGHELPGGGWVWDPGPKINSNTCAATAKPT
jgi:hypothetical protein